MKSTRSQFRKLRQQLCRFVGLAATAWLALAMLASTISARDETGGIQQSEVILQPAGDVDEHDSFGTAVAIRGNTMVIGGFNADGVEAGAGAAFIFERSNNTWVQTAKIFAADGKAEPVPLVPGDFRSDSFGRTVAISEDENTVIAGAPGHAHPGLPSNSGAVYVFQKINGAWTQQAELLSPFPNAHDEFGDGDGFGGISISRNTIVVTDEGNNFFLPGAVDVFTQTNGAWSLATQLMVPDDFFFTPSSIAFDGTTLVVGSTLSDAPTAFLAGTAYVFRFEDGNWSAPSTLFAADATTNAQFGSSVSLSDNRIAVGAITAPGATLQSGAAYVFASDDGVWRQRAKLAADDGIDFDNFGFSISISGNIVLVGAISHTPPLTGALGVGAAYVFRQTQGAWTQIAELAASDGISGGDFGVSVAVLGNTLLVGADLQHPQVEGYPGGEAYIFDLNQ